MLASPPENKSAAEIDDKPVSCHALKDIGPLRIPNVVFGAGSFSNQYNSDAHLAGTGPLQAVRLALRYGIRAFDTSPYYGPSEIILGNALKAIATEFPRSSYQLMTKCGRYGLDKFDYSPGTIRDSVKRSLERLHTDYLDAVYLHDVEFVCTAVTPKSVGDHSFALSSEAKDYGLAEGDEGVIHGEGDQQILTAYAELQKLKGEGFIRHIGITGYPLPTLLRLALLILHRPPYQPVDVLLSYSHLSLQNSTFTAFAPHFRDRARVSQIIAASPLSMGLLTSTPPAWHPAPPRLLDAVAEIRGKWAGDLPDLALGSSIRLACEANGGVPLVVGFSNPKEVHHCMKVWHEIALKADETTRRHGEQLAQQVFKDAGYLNWSWASP